MKKLLFLFLFVFAGQATVFSQLPKIDKSKIPVKPKKGGAEEPARKSEEKSGGTNSTTTANSGGSRVSAEEQNSWYNFYQAVTGECESMAWKEGLYEGYFLSMVENNFDKLETYKWLCRDLPTRIEKDKEKSPETFRFYGNKAETPQGMEYGGTSKDVLPSKLQWVNSSVTKYYIWRGYVNRDQGSIAKAIAKYVEASQERMSANADLNTRIAYEYVGIGMILCKGFENIQGKNTALDETFTKLDAQRNKILNHIRPKLSGKFHEEKLQQVVAFSSKQVLGKENPAQQTKELIPGKFAHIAGYAVEPLNRFGAKSTQSTGGRETLPPIYLKYTHANGNTILVKQGIYANKALFDANKEKFAVEFEWFPELTSINYKSHLEFMPVMHLGNYFLNVPNGNYPVQFMFGNDIHTDIGCRGEFVLKIDDEIKTSLKTYLDQLWNKKLESVTFNSQYGATDNRNIISNWEELKKFGYPEKVTVERTGQVMKPWPKDNEIESFVGSGWCLVKRDDGKYEVIGLSFVQKPGEKTWRWTAIASDMDYYILLESGNGDNVRVHPKRIGQGYEILQQNIGKSSVW
ncbi:MAG: hypothetical protein ACK40M_05570 [Flavobacteriales bacterium]